MTGPFGPASDRSSKPIPQAITQSDHLSAPPIQNAEEFLVVSGSLVISW
jgi:hypothetical protein